MYDEAEGYICIAAIDRKSKKKNNKERFFQYPDELSQVIDFIDKNYLERDVYYCPHLLSSTKRVKENAVAPYVLWADVDTCPVDELFLPPTVLIESSPEKTQALWKLDKDYLPKTVEGMNKRMAYTHAPSGMDKTGFDLTQLLRVPYTLNHKYNPPETVSIINVEPKRIYPLDAFKQKYPEDKSAIKAPALPFPDDIPQVDGDDILQTYQSRLNPRAIKLYREEPGPQDDWSKLLWELNCTLIESNVPLEEAFVIAWDSSCNKYAREGRSKGELWAEIVKAHQHVEAKYAPLPPNERPDYTASSAIDLAPILTDDERQAVAKDITLVEEIIEWAKGVTDAAYQYHQAGAFTVLSTLLAGRVTLPMSFATIRPNLWFMILGDTTLTRKSTAMDLAMDLLEEVDPSALLATDGSIEGLLTALSTRPGRPSLFLRDEFTGLLDMINKRDYYAGMLEALTKLYDGRDQKRVLKKQSDSIEVRNPVFNLFAGGIKEKTLDLLSEQYITSGFIPRFVFIMAETDMTRLRPAGPATAQGMVERNNLVKKIKKVYNFYKTSGMVVDADEHKITIPKMWEATLTDEALTRYNLIDHTMMTEALESENEQLLMPCMIRLAQTGLKVALIIAAVRSTEIEELVITEQDILHAFFYVEQWREWTVAIVEGAQSGPQERQLMKIYRFIKRNPGVSRSKIMSRFKLYSGGKGGDPLGTLEERGMVTKSRQGVGHVYRAVEGAE